MNNLEFKPEIIFILISTLATILSCLAAWRSISIAKRALQLAEITQIRNDAPLSLYLIDCFRIQPPNINSGKCCFCFSLMITNKSVQPNSIVTIELQVDCIYSDGRKIKYSIPHSPLIANQINEIDISPFECPILINGKETLSKYALFPELGIIPSEVRCESYKVIVTDADGKNVTVSNLIMSDFSDEKNQKNKTK